MQAFVFSAIAALLLMAGLAQAEAPRRVALVVGNDVYQSLSPLHNPGLDARTLATILDANGFDVIKCDGQKPGCYDLTREGLLDALDRLREKAEGAELALVFYSGHGMETKADGNVLAPVDMEVVDCATRALRRSLPLENVFKAMAGARQKIVILDACRNDPFAQCPKARGFAPVSFGALAVPAESFMLVASTKPGDVADDGLEGAHSPFAKALVYWLENAPQIHFHQLFLVHVTHKVIEETRGGRFIQLPETRMIGPPPEGCLKGAECVGDMRTAELAQENEQLKAQLARDQELGRTVRDYLAEAEKARGRPLSEEERRRALEELKVATRDIAARRDTRGERALQRLKEGDPVEAERLFAEELENETKAAAERNVRAARAARNLAALAQPTNVAKAAEYYKRATDLDPADGQTWLDLARAALAAGRIADARLAFENAASKARDAANSPLLFAATLGLGDAERTLGSLPNARQLYGEALAMAESGANVRRDDLARQYDIAVSQIRIGGVLDKQGDLPAALESYKAAHAINERLAMADPGNARWQQGLFNSHGRIGKILGVQGNLPAALESFKAAQAIAERLAKNDPSDSRWQDSLAVSHAAIAEVRVRQGNLSAALESYKAVLVITERLAKADSSNTVWQQRLSASYAWLGDTLTRQGNLPAALENYKASHAINERLAKSDPSNTDWLRGLSISHNRLADVLARQGNLPAALENYKASQAINARLTKADLSNTELQQDLSASHGWIGDILFWQGNAKTALESYKAALTINERLSRTDPSNTTWQWNLSSSHGRIGDVLLRQDNAKAALESYKAALAINERLSRTDPSNTSWQWNLSSSHGRIGDVLLRQDNAKAALESYQAALAINERLAKSNPSNMDWQQRAASLQRLVGTALWATGDRTQAIASYRKALATADAIAATMENLETRSAGKPDTATAQRLQNVAWCAIFARDFDKALAASERARALAGDEIKFDINRAHALLYLNRTREAKALYLAHKGKMVLGKPWEAAITDDFDALRKGGLANPQMAKIEAALGRSR
jgi:tetratricopeptide (TPR) repeat protein